ncbi:hypothetical protein B296_00006004 [Ensete ventricosum]|uniref:Uncharacterized protein n=1 Tax=Ensete ventricosum TaxID=4639 RepID=A0A427AWN2_ENSVE|nr:hypothetical protein B296_00006004 [Ensete ventricosum]
MLRPGVMCGRRAVGELDCSSAYIRLREPNKSEDKTESTDREKRDVDARQQIVTPWAWQRHGTTLRESVGRERGRGGVLDQGKKYTVCSVVPFLLKGVGDKDDGEDGTIPRATKTIKDLLQVGVKFCSFQAKLLAFRKFDGSEKANHNN